MWQPRTPLTAAEEVVDFDAHQTHILDQRVRVESQAWPAARRFANSIVLHNGIPSQRAWDELLDRLVAQSALTYAFGYRSALREIQALRRRKAGRPGLVPASSGAPSLEHYRMVVGTAKEAAGAYSSAVVRAWEPHPEDWPRLERRSRQLLHNAVLELIGRVLNLGRTHAALGGELSRPLAAAIAGPTLWAMRSEQLDTNTCGPCDGLHGEIVSILSPEYAELLPPNGCLGRGRCRGIMVYADDIDDLRTQPGQQRLESTG